MFFGVGGCLGGLGGKRTLFHPLFYKLPYMIGWRDTGSERTRSSDVLCCRSMDPIVPCHALPPPYHLTRIYLLHSHPFPSPLFLALLCAVRQLPMWLLVCSMGLWLHVPACAAVIRAHWWFYYTTGGLLFVDAACKLMVSHTCDQEYQPRLLGVALLATTPIAIKLA